MFLLCMGNRHDIVRFESAALYCSIPPLQRNRQTDRQARILKGILGAKLGRKITHDQDAKATVNE